MDPIAVYNTLRRARGKLFEWLRPLPDADYRREFPLGMKRLSATLPHMMLAEWAYAWRMEKGTKVDWSQAAIARDAEPAFAEVERLWTEQAERTLQVIEACRAGTTPSGGWGTIHETRHPIDGKTMVVRAAASDIFMQLFSHETHHRAQAMSMLRMLGVAAQDLDYSLMTYITWE